MTLTFDLLTCNYVHLLLTCLEHQNGKAQEAQNWQDGSQPVNLFRGQKVKGQGHQAD